jgi:hypothetical protein
MPARNHRQGRPQLIATTMISHKDFGNNSSSSLDSSSNHSTKSVGQSLGKEEEKKRDNNDRCESYDTTDNDQNSKHNKPQRGILMTLERKTSERSLASFILERKNYDRSLASFTTKNDDEKVVEFRSTVRVRRIPSHRQFSSEERTAIWYDSNEIEKRDASIRSIVKELSSTSTSTATTTTRTTIDSTNNNENDNHYRGLEHRLHTKNNKKRIRRKAAILRLVLDEQEKIYRNNWLKKQQQLDNAYNKIINNNNIIIDIDDDDDDDDDNDTSLAEVYTSCNWNDRLEARRRGIEDALASDD